MLAALTFQMPWYTDTSDVPCQKGFMLIAPGKTGPSAAATCVFTGKRSRMLFEIVMVCFSWSQTGKVKVR